MYAGSAAGKSKDRSEDAVQISTGWSEPKKTKATAEGKGGWY